MKTTVTKSEFTAAFHNMGRGDNFSHAGLCALYDWLKELAEDCGTENELDVIAICCEYSEYESIEEIAKNYGEEFDDDADDDDRREWLNDHTMFIEFDGGVIIQDF